MNFKKHLARDAKKDGWYYCFCGREVLENHIMDKQAIRSIRPDNLCITCYNRYIHHITLKERNII